MDPSSLLACYEHVLCNFVHIVCDEVICEQAFAQLALRIDNLIISNFEHSNMHTVGHILIGTCCSYRFQQQK